MAADIRQFQLGRLHVGEFEKQRKGHESRITALERENGNLKFLNKQCSSQYKKLERDYLAQEKILNAVRKCAACLCLENRRRTAHSADGRRTWETLLAEAATLADGIANPSYNAYTNESTYSSAATFKSTQHTNPTDHSRREGLSEEVHLLRETNLRLQSTIDQLQTDVNRKTAQINSLQRRTNTSSDHGNSSRQSLAAKDREIADLRSQVSELLMKNMEVTKTATAPRSDGRSTSADRALDEVQTTVRQFEQELVALRGQRRELTDRLAALEEDVNAKETSLKRSEGLLEQANKDKERLAAQVRRHKRDDPQKRSTSQVAAAANRSRSELAVNNVASGSRPSSRSRSPFGGNRSANIYCPVCREMRDQLHNLSHTTRAQSASGSPTRSSGHRFVEKATSSPDSGFADRGDKATQLLRLREQLSKEQMSNRLLKHERDSLKQLHEKANVEADRLRRELLNRYARPSTSAKSGGDASDLSPDRLVSRLRTDNDKLRRQLQILKEQFESDIARHKANESLTTAQKTKAEQDYREALSRCDRAQAQVAALSRQVAEREISIEQLNAQLIHQLSLRTTDSSAAAGAQVADYDNLVADLTSKLRRTEVARTTAETSCVALRRNLEDARAESSRLHADAQSLRRQMQQLADSSGDAAEASTAILKLQLRDKDLEINALRSRVHDLDVEYQKFENGLAEQQATLHRLQHDLSVSSSQKGDSEKRCVWLQEENGRLAARMNQLENDNSALRTELESALVQQDYLNASAEKYISEIQTYQKLLSEKETQRTSLLAQLQDANLQARRADSVVRATRSTDDLSTMEANLRDLQLQSVKDELDSARAEKSKLVEERRALEARINRCERELDAVRCELDSERGQKESLHADLAAARQQLIAAENHAIDLTAKLSHAETELQKARAQIDSLSSDVELQKAKAMAAAATVSELEQALATNRQQYADAVRDGQQRIADVQLLKERIYDYEAKLELQGRDVVEARSKLGQADKDLEVLRRELSDERFERQRLQGRLNNNSQSTASS
uniref:Uncharacterized protein n=1 Tax=Plectus sambesii TaxID=2011161 RepID=A0A914W3W0_9BILA